MSKNEWKQPRTRRRKGMPPVVVIPGRADAAARAASVKQR